MKLRKALFLLALVLVLLALRVGTSPSVATFPALGPAPSPGVMRDFNPPPPEDYTFGSNGLGGGSYAP